MTPKPVCLKKLILRKKQPNIQNTILVARLINRLQRKLIAQQFSILMPFIRIIWISFSSFYSTTRYRNTGKSKLKAKGKMIVATVLINMSMNTELSDSKGRQVYPEVIFLPVVCLMKALDTMSITLSNPSGIMKKGLYLTVQLASSFISISEMPLGLQNRNSRTSFTRMVASNRVLLAFLNSTAPSGKWQAALVCVNECKVSLFRNSYRLNRSWVIDSLHSMKTGGMPLQLASPLLIEVLMLRTLGQVASTELNNPLQPSVPCLCPTKALSSAFSHQNINHCCFSRQTTSVI